jgi:hypothetical protein
LGERLDTFDPAVDFFFLEFFSESKLCKKNLDFCEEIHFLQPLVIRVLTQIKWFNGSSKRKSSIQATYRYMDATRIYRP